MSRGATTPITLTKAIEVFARGFAFCRSFTHPYEVRREAGFWDMRDAPRRNREDLRNEEWIAWGKPPKTVDAAARRHSRGRFAVSYIRRLDEPDAPLRTGFKALGYRLHTTEPLMVHDLKKIRRPAPPRGISICRVTTSDLADRLAKAARSRQILVEHLRPDAPLRQYVALKGSRPIGWVRSIVVKRATWVSNMYVEPAFRRRGIGRAMLDTMLHDDKRAGATASILTASVAGSRLYENLGYSTMAELLLFIPRRT